MLSASLATVAVDQVLWCVDVFCFILLGKFPIGVAKLTLLGI